MQTMGQIGSLIVVGDIGDHPDEYLLDRREGVSSVENQDDDQFNTTSTSTYYGNGTAISGDILPWGVQSSWNGTDFSVDGDFADDKYAFVIDSGVSSFTGDLNIRQT